MRVRFFELDPLALFMAFSIDGGEKARVEGNMELCVALNSVSIALEFEETFGCRDHFYNKNPVVQRAADKRACFSGSRPSRTWISLFIPFISVQLSIFFLGTSLCLVLVLATSVLPSLCREPRAFERLIAVSLNYPLSCLTVFAQIFCSGLTLAGVMRLVIVLEGAFL